MSWHYHPDDVDDDEVPDYLSVKHFMLYWKVDPIIRPDIAQHMTTAYAASKYLKRVKPGDVLWIVTVYQYRLYLLGRLKVEFVVDDTAIAQALLTHNPKTGMRRIGMPSRISTRLNPCAKSISRT